MITIKWIPAYSLHNVGSSEDITFFPPEPAFKFFTQNRNNSGFLRCPAFSNILKNTFIIRSPYDLTVLLDRKHKSVKIKGYDQDFFQKNIQLHDVSSPTDPMMVALPPRYIFITDSKLPVNVVSMPMILQSNKNGLIPGSFDITRWIRPVEYTIEVYDDTVPIEINRGDPLFMVKFETADDSAVVLEKDIMSHELAEVVDRCISVKNSVKGQNLKSLYSMAYEYIELMKTRIFKKKQKFFNRL